MAPGQPVLSAGADGQREVRRPVQNADAAVPWPERHLERRGEGAAQKP
jgi:hypothetical protein